MAMTLTGSPQITAAALNTAINTELATNWFPLAGTAAVGNAAAGQIGEFISSSVAVGSAVALTTNVTANVTSISLTAGDWEIWGAVGFSPAATTSITNSQGSISGTSATMTLNIESGAKFVQITPAQVPGAGSYGFPIGRYRLNQSATSTMWLVAYSLFTVSTNSAFGGIFARRVR